MSDYKKLNDDELKEVVGGQGGQVRATINLNLCVECGWCKDECPSDAIIVSAGGQYVVDQAKCNGCGKCSGCPAEAINFGV